MFEDEYFKGKTLNTDKLPLYGFSKKDGAYLYQTEILDGQFRLDVEINSSGRVFTHLWENESDEEYVLYKVEGATGTFVGEVRCACGAVLKEISDQCCESDAFMSKQAHELMQYVRATYSDELEFLWTQFPDNAIWRRKDNQKWYGLMVTVAGNKFGQPSDEPVEIIDLRLQPDKMQDTVDNEKYFPGWHMNKKSWYTILLNGSVDTAEICGRIDESYRLAAKKQDIPAFRKKRTNR